MPPENGIIDHKTYKRWEAANHGSVLGMGAYWLILYLKGGMEYANYIGDKHPLAFWASLLIVATAMTSNTVNMQNYYGNPVDEDSGST